MPEVKLYPAQGRTCDYPKELKVVFQAFWRPAIGIFCTCTSAVGKSCARWQVLAFRGPLCSQWLGVKMLTLMICTETLGSRVLHSLQAGHQPAKSYGSAKGTVSCPWGQCKHHFIPPQWTFSWRTLQLVPCEEGGWKGRSDGNKGKESLIGSHAITIFK